MLEHPGEPASEERSKPYDNALRALFSALQDSRNHSARVQVVLQEQDASAALLGQQGGTAVGFKLFPEHMRKSERHADVAERVLQDARVKKVVLVRENRLAVAVSKLRAAVTGASSPHPLCTNGQ
jgi:hypothetical protein